mmetsp:Transcript_98857/g.308285  ORF Transcript_98857/g.308285 Transcript_98857/m.308285 type:complete len:221 (-) Transcript_98857:2204-2866(-)
MPSHSSHTSPPSFFTCTRFTPLQEGSCICACLQILCRTSPTKRLCGHSEFLWRTTTAISLCSSSDAYTNRPDSIAATRCLWAMAGVPPVFLAPGDGALPPSAFFPLGVPSSLLSTVASVPAGSFEVLPIGVAVPSASAAASSFALSSSEGRSSAASASASSLAFSSSSSLYIPDPPSSLALPASAFGSSASASASMASSASALSSSPSASCRARFLAAAF